MYLIIVFVLGTLCVVFNEKIGEFFSRFVDFDLFFSIKKSRKNQTTTVGVLKRLA